MEIKITCGHGYDYNNCIKCANAEIHRLNEIITELMEFVSSVAQYHEAAEELLDKYGKQGTS